MKKFFRYFFICLIIILILLIPVISKYPSTEKITDIVEDLEILPSENKLEIPDESSKADKNNNGIADTIDMVESAEKSFNEETPYKDAYYVGGYPPDTEGVCTDVIWRGFKAAGIDLKTLMDKDIQKNISSYGGVNGKPDPNIDFRRVKNQKVFFDKYCSNETTEVIANDIENLKQWQPGDILLFLKPYEHVGIISNERDSDGIPFVLHNSHPKMKKSKLSWFPLNEIYHYRWNF